MANRLTPIRPALAVLVCLHPISINLQIFLSKNGIYCGTCCSWRTAGPKFGFAPLLLKLTDATTAHRSLFAFCHIISLQACAYFQTRASVHTRTHTRVSAPKVPVPLTHSFLWKPRRRRTQANKGTRDENRAREETRSCREKEAGLRTSFLGIKLCIFSSLLADQLPQDASAPNQRPAVSVYSAVQETRRNQTHFSKEKLCLLWCRRARGGEIHSQSRLIESAKSSSNTFDTNAK